MGCGRVGFKRERMCCRWFATVTMLARRLELALARLCECESHFSTISRHRPLTRADRGARPSISPAAPDSHGSRMRENPHCLPAPVVLCMVFVEVLSWFAFYSSPIPDQTGHSQAPSAWSGQRIDAPTCNPLGCVIAARSGCGRSTTPGRACALRFPRRRAVVDSALNSL